MGHALDALLSVGTEGRGEPTGTSSIAAALSVLSIAFPFAPVVDRAVGGAEQILSTIDRALVIAGHRSLVVACQGSQSPGELFSFPVLNCEMLDDRPRRCVQEAINRALSQCHVDLIHMHGLDFHRYLLPEEIPKLVTLHLPASWYPKTIWRTSWDRVQFQCVSETQRRSFAEFRDFPVIENGVTLPPFWESERRRDFGLVLGRICPEKNAHAALQAGNLAGTPILIGGQVFPYEEHRKYFQEEILPLLGCNAGRIEHRFLGPLAPDRRQKLLAHAKCLLHPTLAPETSSLVAMEALATGTPVIAYRSGALSEIVEDGVTGFLVDNVEEMAAAIRDVTAISSK